MQAAVRRSVAVRPIVLRAFLITLAIFLAGGGLVYLWALSALPDYEGDLTLAGPAHDITILRDRHAVPHIRAATADDAYFALGFAHAQDRLWQLEMHRRIGAGQLAAILGEPALRADIFVRTLGIHRAAARAYRTLDAQTQRMLTRYSDGINAYLAARKGALPLEFLLLQAKPMPWTPVDCLAWLKMMAWDLSANWRQETSRLALLSRLTPTQVSQFLPPYPGDPPVVPPSPEAVYPGVILNPAGDRQALLAPALPGLPGLGSNNWAVDGAHSQSGLPLLANDPHLGVNAPSLWYLAHLEIAGRNIVGATMAGMPLVVLGRNDHLAWGFTTTAADVQDLYIERLAGGDDRYETESGARLFRMREERIAVRGRGEITVRVRE
ncbi:MAG: penicillin acylase family protein, partial [Alphaproteobacteria bacterium]